jgi:thioredoxin 1
MASQNIKEITDDNFEAEVLKSDVPTLVDFWAIWCGPCKQIAPLVDAVADEFQGRLKVGKMDIDRHQITPQRYQIKSIPTLLLFKDGKVVGQLIGTMQRKKLEDEIKKHLEDESKKPL